MGLFDFFKKKKDDVSKTTGESKNTSSSPETSIEINDIDNGSHGDNFGGLLGFAFLNTEAGEAVINKMIDQSVRQAPLQSRAKLHLHESDFKQLGGNTDQIRIRTLAESKSVLSAYPYLHTDYIIPFETKKIQEWAHVGRIEAEIQGSGRDTFGLGFFATDYAINQNKYKNQKKINIRISAIALVMDESKIAEDGEMKFSKDFAAYMPSQDIPRPTYYDFIGELLDFRAVRILENNTGFLAKVKLINMEEDADFFSVDIFINKENMRIDKLEKGMKVTGALWFQGELA